MHCPAHLSPPLTHQPTHQLMAYIIQNAASIAGKIYCKDLSHRLLQQVVQCIHQYRRQYMLVKALANMLNQNMQHGTMQDVNILLGG